MDLFESGKTEYHFYDRRFTGLFGIVYDGILLCFIVLRPHGLGALGDFYRRYLYSSDDSGLVMDNI